MKLLKQFICIVVCFVLLSSSFSAYALDFDFSDYPDSPPLEDMLDVLDPYAPMTLAANPSADFYAGKTFGITDAIRQSEDFYYLEDLPYGEDTLVISLYQATVTYMIFLKADDIILFLETWGTSNGNCRVSVASLSPIYRIGYNSQTGALVSFYSAIGLSDKNVTTSTTGNLTTYNLVYTFIAGDFNVTVSKNKYAPREAFVQQYEGYDNLTCAYGEAFYPTRQDAQNDTSKGIWDTIKSLWETVKNLPSTISQAFSNWFDVIIGWIQNIITDIKALPDNIGSAISRLLQTLRNYLLYFSAEEPEDLGFNSTDYFYTVKEYINERAEDTTNFVNSLDSSFNNIKSYIESGSGIINKLLSGAPVLNFFFVFLMAFAVVRKVVGR